MTPRKNVTIHDIAARVGVSYQTVSRVINEHPNVAPKTRERIQKAIAELGYQPTKAAQSLAGRHSRIIGVFTLGLDYYGPFQMMLNTEHAAREIGYDIVVFNSADTSPENIKAGARYFSRWQVDGVLVITPMPGSSYEDLLEMFNAPIVQIDTRHGASTPSVVIDQFAGSQLATEHLIQLGHQKICEISGPMSWYGAVARHKGWVEMLKQHDLPIGQSVEGDWTAKSGYFAAKELLTLDAEFSALVVGNDQMALGVIRALQETGKRIPEEISIVGFDDIPEAPYFSPPLSTVRQDFASLGERGVQYLIELIQHPDAPHEQRTIDPELIVRSSTIPYRR